MNASAPLRAVFTQNRTEEIGDDVYSQFVVPPFFSDLDLLEARKPRVIVGGRGCGKTMLLLYLSHRSTFSRDRKEPIPVEALRHIGLYWRSDTQFAQRMRGSGVPSEAWEAAFEHLIALVIGLEALESLKSIALSECPAVTTDDLKRVQLDELRGFGADLTGSVEMCTRVLRQRLHEFELWVSNPERLARPVFLPGSRFLAALIESLRAQVPSFDQASFFVYVDEYENLQIEQQRVINTYLKHSKHPLIFNIAVKRNGIVTNETTGPEALQNVADYREHDLEEYLEPHFDLFAAEVLLLGLAIANYNVPIDTSQLRDISAISSRQGKDYRETVLRFVRAMLPGRTERELAIAAFEDPSLVKLLRRRVDQALRQRASSLSAEAFLRPSLPEASIVVSALLNRSRTSDLDILKELDALEIGADNRFTGPTDWIHNNFVGALLSLYEPYGKVCEFYSGFDTFCVLSRANLRHFRELCHRALNRVPNEGTGIVPAIDTRLQAEAAREASATFLGQVKSAGRLGNRLHTFVLRLGSLFAVAHARPTQSEPEICHFAVTRGARDFTPTEEEFLREATKWSVLFAERETKVKDSERTAAFDYVLNPIYAPYFTISYRKRRKLELSIDAFSTLAAGTYEDYKVLMRRYTREWAVDPKSMNPSLFSHLSGDE